MGNSRLGSRVNGFGKKTHAASRYRLWWAVFAAVMFANAVVFFFALGNVVAIFGRGDEEVSCQERSVLGNVSRKVWEMRPGTEDPTLCIIAVFVILLAVLAVGCFILAKFLKGVFDDWLVRILAAIGMGITCLAVLLITLGVSLLAVFAAHAPLVALLLVALLIPLFAGVIRVREIHQAKKNALADPEEAAKRLSDLDFQLMAIFALYLAIAGLGEWSQPQ